jgi:hypothetical protein
MNHQNPDAWGRLQVENVYIAPAAGAVAAPPAVGSVPPIQPRSLADVYNLTNLNIDNLELAFNTTFAGANLAARMAAVVIFYTHVH